MQRHIQYGDLAIFRDSNGKEWLRKIEKGKLFQTHQGVLPYDKIVGNSYGIIYQIQKDSILIMEPRASQFTKNTKHSTNIIYEGDAVAMLSEAGVGPGDQVLEIGSGSGSLTYYLALFCTRNSLGKVVTIDLREDHSQTAKENLEKMNLANSVSFRVGALDIVLPEKRFFDAAFIDMATPWEVLPHIKDSLKLGKSIMIFLPNFYQVEETIRVALDLNLTLIDVFETFRRDLAVNPEKHVMRPKFRGIMYSGIIIHLLVSFIK